MLAASSGSPIGELRIALSPAGEQRTLVSAWTFTGFRVGLGSVGPDGHAQPGAEQTMGPLK
jgi:hypothetical protein